MAVLAGGYGAADEDADNFANAVVEYINGRTALGADAIGVEFQQAALAAVITAMDNVIREKNNDSEMDHTRDVMWFTWLWVMDVSDARSYRLQR